MKQSKDTQVALTVDMLYRGACERDRRKLFLHRLMSEVVTAIRKVCGVDPQTRKSTYRYPQEMPSFDGKFKIKIIEEPGNHLCLTIRFTPDGRRGTKVVWNGSTGPDLTLVHLNLLWDYKQRILNQALAQFPEIGHRLVQIADCVSSQ